MSWNWTKEQTVKLRSVLLDHAKKIREADPDRTDPANQDTAELIRVLSRMVEGKSLYDSFGAPGDWGYESPIGSALSDLYKLDGKRVTVPAEREEMSGR